ncbi:hypothetical protein [Streptomyces sp. CA-111067]|uniref:hypothetical protein n=1 Tax=Streptomyces sp. CA-111067 TaxID=3240046 RepID=UPI003D959C19
MRLSTVILPIYRWTEGRKVWKGAEELGFHAAYKGWPWWVGDWYWTEPVLLGLV